MNEKETKTAFIAGYEVDADIARTLLGATIPSVTRAVEELVIAGKGDAVVKAAAKTTAEAVAGAIVDLLKVKAKTADQVCSTSQVDHQGRAGSQVQEA